MAGESQRGGTCLLGAFRAPFLQAEEIANSISHGLWLIAALVGVPLLIVHAARRGDAAFIVGASLFSATISLLYLASTVYHALPMGKAKRAVRVLDHSSIFLLIAGTYAHPSAQRI